MALAIVIVFEYELNSLKGASSDLDLAVGWCKSFGCNINVFTDIPERGTTVLDSSSLSRGIMDIPQLERYSKLVIYYSGHGKRDSMVMPNESLLLFIDFRDEILKRVDKYAEIFWILDCCNPNGMNLPYKLKGNVFRLSTVGMACTTQAILLITSSESHERSIATREGSIFSKYLFSTLFRLNEQPVIHDSIIPVSKNRNLRRLVSNLSSSIRSMNTGHSQTVSVYSSYITDPILWMWIGSNKSYDIVSDITLSTLIVRVNRMNNSLQ